MWFRCGLSLVFRGYMVRKKVKPMIEERKKAATTIQARLRGYFERKKTKNSQKQQESALKIQRGESGVISLNSFRFFFLVFAYLSQLNLRLSFHFIGSSLISFDFDSYLVKQITYIRNFFIFDFLFKVEEEGKPCCTRVMWFFSASKLLSDSLSVKILYYFNIFLSLTYLKVTVCKTCNTGTCMCKNKFPFSLN